jgi:hypothetical protein
VCVKPILGIALPDCAALAPMFRIAAWDESQRAVLKYLGMPSVLRNEGVSVPDVALGPLLVQYHEIEDGSKHYRLEWLA